MRGSLKAATKKNSVKKKVPGKSSMNAISEPTMYKPTLYLENKQIPSSVGKVGQKVLLTVEAKVARMVERQDGKGKTREVSLEIQKMK